jgi:hypothetical protein
MYKNIICILNSVFLIHVFLVKKIYRFFSYLVHCIQAKGN